MKSLFFILLAGYAVRSDENNYYVIEMPEDPPMQTKKPFRVYWNVPTMQCSSKKIPFENLYEDFGIMQNDNDRFKGEKITILYDPGLFPALFKNETSGKFRFRNGGVPQEGDLTKHLDAFKKELDHSIPEKNFSGVGIIDFESWRPVFRQNFGVLQPYKDVSIEIERKLHWWWKKPWIEAEAKRRFEEAARLFMQTTLSVAKQLRPHAQWGFYGFPYCFNMASNNMVEGCASHVPEENDQISWLWAESSALYPSVYSSSQLGAAQLAALVRGRVREAARCVAGNTTALLPYFWFRYRDAGFLTETDLTTALSTLYESNATGILIWGSSNDVNTVNKCNNLLNYVKTVLGPAIAKYTKPTNKVNNENNTANTTSKPNINVTSDNSVSSDASNSSTKFYLDPEFHWTPPVNYSQEIKNHVEEEIKRKLGHNITDDNDKHTVLQNNNVLIDLILNTVLNSVDNASSTSNETTKAKNDKKNQQDNEDLIINTTEVNANTDSSQVTNNHAIYEINNTSQQVELKNVYMTSADVLKSDEITTTEKTEQQTASIDSSTIYSPVESGIVNFMSVTPSTDKLEVFVTTENDYDAILDSDDDYFFNVDTFVSHDLGTDDPIDTTTTSFESKLTKNTRKELQASTTEPFTTQNLKAGTDISIETTTMDNKSRSEILSSEITIELTTKSFTEMSEFSTGFTDTTKYDNLNEIVTKQSDIPLSVKPALYEENGDEAIESSSYTNEFTTEATKDNSSETFISKGLEMLKDKTNVTINPDNATTEELSKITETTTVVPTSTEQVVV